MPKRLLVFFILTFFLLAACSGADQASVAEAPVPEAPPQPAEVEPTVIEPTQPEPTQQEPTEASPSDAGGAMAPAMGSQMECTLVSDQPEAPAELVAIFGVTEDDWVKGPATAAVTIVEYSDFQ